MPFYTAGRHLNLNVRSLDVSATLRINELSNELRASGRDVFKMGLGQSPFEVPDSVVEELRQHAREKDYLPVRGLQPLRQAVADFHNKTQGLNHTAEDVLIGPGSKELMFLLQMVYYGDLVIPTPSWVSYAPQAQIIGRHVRWIDTCKKNDWRLTPEELDEYCSHDPCCPRIIILNYPSNPTGCSYTPSELEALAKVARKYSILVLSDEIYGELHFNGQYNSIARYYPEGTIISSGLSKWAGAGGWRLGTFVFPENLHWLLDAMAVVASETFTSTSAPIQYAGIKAFELGPDIETYLQHSRAILGCLSDRLYNKFQTAGICVPKPVGAFYMFPDFSDFRDSLRQRGITNSQQLCQRLLTETGVAILPGTDFGRPGDELTARLAYVNFDGGAAIRETEVHGDEVVNDDFLQRHCPRTLQGIDRICDWIRG